MLNIKAKEIANWSKEDEFPVLIRKLVKTTSNGIANCHFHAWDNSNKSGVDGYVELLSGIHQYIPDGVSYWELSTGESDIKRKANDDFKKRSEYKIRGKVNKNRIFEKNRKKSVFVFVTSRQWSEKDKWVEEKKKLGKWKNVKVYDAGDLEAWIEDSPLVENWIGKRIGRSADGLIALTDYWKEWNADSKKVSGFDFPAEIFKTLYDKNKELIEQFTKNDTETDSLNVYADSTEEMCAFLYYSFSKMMDEEEFDDIDNMVVVETESGVDNYIKNVLSALPIFCNDKIYEYFVKKTGAKNRFIRFHNKVKGIMNTDQGITLSPLTNRQFIDGFKNSGINTERFAPKIDNFHEQSNGSLTVLRQRMTDITPIWADDTSIHEKLIPIMLLGAWKTDDSYIGEKIADSTIVEGYTRWTSKELQKNFNDLLNLKNDVPVWREGSVQGVNSKVNLFFNLFSYVTKEDVDNFYDMAERVLFQLDWWRYSPYKSMEDEEYKKMRVSQLFNNNICDTMKMLTALGNRITGLGHHYCKRKSEKVVNNIMSNIKNVRDFEAQVVNFPKYAEAAPEAFLDTLRNKLLKLEGAKEYITKKKNNFVFEQNNAIFLIWALETLAWMPEYFNDIVDIFIDLYKTNPSNKGQGPLESLCSLFRYCYPQTSAGYEKVRKPKFEKILINDPDIAWEIMIPQIKGISSFQVQNRPSWDFESINHPYEFCYAFRDFCCDKMLGWNNPSLNQIFDIIKIVGSFRDEYTDMLLLDLILKHAKNSKDIDKEKIKEEVKMANPSSDAVEERIDQIAEILEPNDVYLQHKHLFDNNFPRIGPNRGYEDDDEMMEKFWQDRSKAVKEIYDKKRLEGIIELALMVSLPINIGGHLVELISDNEIKEIIRLVIDNEKNEKFESLFAGLFHGIPLHEDEENQKRITDIIIDLKGLSDANWVYLMTLVPFVERTWKLVEEKNKTSAKFDFKQTYWITLKPTRRFRSNEEGFRQRNIAIRNLLETKDLGSLFYAFQLTHVPYNNINKIECDSLFQIVKKISELDENTYNEQTKNLVGMGSKPYHFEQIMKVLRKTPNIPVKELAMIEIMFIAIGIFDRHSSSLESFNKEFSRSPEFLCKSINIVYEKDPEKRKGKDKITPHNAKTEDEKFGSGMIFALFGQCIKTPGLDSKGKVNKKKFMDWFNEARRIIPKTHELADKLETYVGDIIGQSPPFLDKKLSITWPSVQVAEIIEELIDDNQVNEDIFVRNIQCGRSRTESETERLPESGGEIERKRSVFYEKLEKQFQGSHPKVAKILHKISNDYKILAKPRDEQASIYIRDNTY